MYIYNAELIRVVDGDTVHAMVDLGFNTWIKANIRLFGIDAYESRTRDLEEKEKGLKAKERLKEILSVNNNKFKLKSHGLDKYGRSLGTLLVEPLGDLNQLLVTEGHAVPYDGGKR